MKKKVDSINDTPAKIKSNGLSSDYYKIYIPADEVTPVENEHGEIVSYIIETESIIRHGLGNDFDKGNIQKVLIRLGKKEGNDDEYELNKMQYSYQNLRKWLLGKGC